MKRRIFAAGLLASAGIAPLQAQGGPLGVVLMHGKQGSQRRSPGLQDIRAKLESMGAKAAFPDMPWSEGAWEKIAVTVEQVHEQIDGHVAALRGQGAQRIVVAGQSLGANMALSYAVARPNVAGLVMAAPGHNPGFSYRNNPSIKADIDRAAELARSGQGAQAFRGGDENQGSSTTLSTTTAVYVSWMNPRGKASMMAQAPLLSAAVPLMLVVGKQDNAIRYAEESIYKPAAKNPYSKYLVVDADHRNTDFAASARIVDWIKALP